MKLLPKNKPRKYWLTSKTWKVMKLTSILVIALTLQVSAAVSSQTVTFSGKNVAFKKVLSVIKNQTNFVFFYDTAILKNVKPISINVVDAPIEKVLQQAFADQPITWIIEGKTISFVPKAEKVKESINLAPVQKQVKGKVTDEKGEPIPGANIHAKGSTKAVQTDSEGNFSIEVPDNVTKLVVSFVGMESQEVSIGNTALSVVLIEAGQKLDEVVVNSLGRRVDKRTLGATVSTIKAEALSTSGETSVINSLQGKASGVRIARSNGDPGAGSNIQIRGANTIFGSTQPLVILDGVPMSNDNINGNNSSVAGTSQQSRLNDINADDIESVNILKGASAAAVWGSEAANGVLVITTKRGKKNGKINVEFKSTTSIDQLSDFHPQQTVFGQGAGGVYVADNSSSWGDKISTRSGAPDEFFTKNEKGYFVDQNGKEHLLIKTKNSKETFVKHNRDQVFQDAISYNHNLSFSNGNERGSYRFSFGSINQNGIVKESDYKKINFGVNTNYKLSDKLDINTKISYTNTKSNRIQQSSTVGGLLLGLLRGSSDFDNEGYIGTFFDKDGLATLKSHRSYRNSIGSGIPAYSNPSWTVYEQKSPSEVDRIIISTDFNYKTNEWLTLKTSGSYDQYSDERRYFFPVFSSTGSAGLFKLDNINNRNINFNFSGQTKTFSLSDNFNGSFIVGYNFDDKLRKSVYNEGSNFIVNSRVQTFANASQIEPSDNRVTKNRKYRLFYTAAFDYKKQIFLNTSAAYEQSSAIKGGFFYPSADVAWVFTELAGLKDNNFINSGKLRFGAGQVGVEPLPHRFQNTYETPTYSDYDDPLNLQLFGGGFRTNDNLNNPNLKPEVKTEYEAGLDLKLFNNRLTLGGTYYFNKIVDVLVDVPLSPSSGVNTIYSNGGILQNKGMEFDFDFNFLKIKNGLNASIYGNFNNNKNEVLSIQGAESIALTSESISSRAVVGHQMGTLWGSKAKRKPDGTFDLDTNGFPQLDAVQGVIGDPNPEWRGGIGFKANYKGFFTNVLIETSQGGQFAERTRFIMGSFGTHTDVANIVTPTQDLKDRAGVIYPAGVPVRGNIKDFGAGPVLLNEAYYTTVGGGLGSSVINEFAINQDASWTRLSEVTFGYTLNSKSFRRSTKLDSMSFTFTGRNLALWTDILGVDPQTNQTGVGNGFGVDYFTNPASKTLLFTLQIKY